MPTNFSTLSRTLCASALAACCLAPVAHAQVVVRTVHTVHPAHPVKVRRAAPVRNARPVVVRAVPIVHNPPRRVVVAASTAGERPRLQAALASLQAASQSMGDSAATLGQLRSAYADLNASAASDVYHSHRYDAINCTRRAIKILKENQPAAEVSSLTNEAIGHVQFCLAAPVEK